jgi:hypothetical protein
MYLQISEGRFDMNSVEELQHKLHVITLFDFRNLGEMQSDLPMFAVYKPIRSRGWVEE